METTENTVAHIGADEQASPFAKGTANTFKYNAGIAHFRLILMLFISINTFGVAGGWIGKFIQILSGFATIAFFIISGFLVLNDDKKRSARIGRTIGRSALTFLIWGAIYFALNAVFYYIGGVNILTMFNYATKRFWFNFLVLNLWPYNIGNIIWFVEAYLFAYIFIFIVNKLKLMKLDWLFFIIFAIIGFASSEFAAFVPFKFFGYACLPQGVITMALPYIFLGSFIRRKIAAFSKIDSIYYVLIGILSIVLCFVEGFVLSKFATLYTTHTFVGISLLAFCICVIVLRPDIVVSAGEVYFHDDMADPDGPSYLEMHFPYYTRWIYYLLQPISIIIMAVSAYISTGFFTTMQNWVWIASYVICLGIAMLVGLLIDVRIKLKVKRVLRSQKKAEHSR